jgi:hypothetical protein
MRITETKQVTTSVVIHKAVVCNRCELTIDKEEVTNGNFLDVWYSGGYGSRMGDCTEYRFDLCESCIMEIIKDFAVQPDIEENY